VVDSDSSKLNLPGVQAIPLDASHKSSCWVGAYQFRTGDPLYLNICELIRECLLTPLSKQIEDWKELHERFQKLNTYLICILGELGPNYLIKDLEDAWMGKNGCHPMILKTMNLSEISEQVKHEFLENTNNQLDTLKSETKNIDTIISQCENPEDLESRIQTLKAEFTSLLMTNSNILSCIDDMLKLRILARKN
jgi:hypothetical protein